MYENQTYEAILQRLLDNVSDEMNKREGSIIYDALAPAAAELAQLYINMDLLLTLIYADTSFGEFLERRCAERGVTRKEATHAVVKGEFVPTTIDVIGKRFRSGDYYFVVMATTDTQGTYQLTCETAGSNANDVIGAIVPIDYIEGLETAMITTVLIPGDDEETDDELRKRYYASISSQAFGGNVTDYEEKTKAIDGVGGVKVTPVWNGGGTVLLTIIASDYAIPSDTLIATVQTNIDAISPIGHTVTVNGVTTVSIDIATNITYQNGWDWSSAGGYITKAVDEYFTLLSKSWEDSDGLVVRISGIEQKILACTGVIDVQNTTLNGSATNIQLGVNEIPVRGGVSDGT